MSADGSVHRTEGRACVQTGTMAGVWKLRCRRRDSGYLSNSRLSCRSSCIMRSSLGPAASKEQRIRLKAWRCA